MEKWGERWESVPILFGIPEHEIPDIDGLIRCGAYGERREWREPDWKGCELAKDHTGLHKTRRS